MKLVILPAFFLIVALSAMANYVEKENRASVDVVQGLYNYCADDNPDNEFDEVFMLQCVNSSLIALEFASFDSYADLIEYLSLEDE